MSLSTSSNVRLDEAHMTSVVWDWQVVVYGCTVHLYCTPVQQHASLPGARLASHRRFLFSSYRDHQLSPHRFTLWLNWVNPAQAPAVVWSLLSINLEQRVELDECFKSSTIVWKLLRIIVLDWRESRGLQSCQIVKLYIGQTPPSPQPPLPVWKAIQAYLVQPQ